MLLASLLALLWSEARGGRRAGGHGDEALVLLHLAQHPITEKLPVVFARSNLRDRAIGGSARTAAILQVERHSPVPRLLVGHGRGIAMTFLGMYVHDSRLFSTLHALEHLYELLDVVAFFQVLVLKSPSLEPVVLTRAMTLAQGTQVLIDSAMILGDRHLVVVNHDDYSRVQFGSLVKALKSLTSRQGAITDDGDDVLVRPLDVACLLQARGKAY